MRFRGRNSPVWVLIPVVILVVCLIMFPHFGQRLMSSVCSQMPTVGGIPHSQNDVTTAARKSAFYVNTPSRPGNLDYEFVIAHYNENLDWLKPVANRSHVYHKGLLKAPPFPVMKWEELPNVGREAHTYLHHIVTHYDHLADITVFLRGHGPAIDVPYCFAHPIDFVVNAKQRVFCVSVGKYSNWDRIDHRFKWLDAMKSGRMRKAPLTMGDFYASLFGSHHPDSVVRCSMGCFAASRENLRRRPISFYQKAMAFLNDHGDPEEVHYMERLWNTIINP